LATKYIRKKQKYNKEQRTNLANRLDTIAGKVAKKGVFIVTQTVGGDYFNVTEVINKRVVLTHILQKNTAQTLCVRLNASTKPNATYDISEQQMKRTQRLLNRYADLFTESVFHKYTIKTTTKTFTRDVAFIRLHETLIKLRATSEELKHQL
jgi:hypothetical protein|tara:strand:- start:4333 stop:4788 length:456 start_codon:yes stop_codon:yes gene_type:complete